MAKKVRTALYTNLLTKNIGWHDLREHQAGLMTVVLAKDAEALEGAATETFAVFLQVSLAAIFVLFLGIYFCW
jgi:hypothetical protein